MAYWICFIGGGVLAVFGLIATSYALHGGALEWLWVGGLICLTGILLMYAPDLFYRDRG